MTGVLLIVGLLSLSVVFGALLAWLQAKRWKQENSHWRVVTREQSREIHDVMKGR